MRTTADPETEQEGVEHWRYDELVRAGYDVEAAEAIAVCADVDLHDAVALIREGCSQAVALKILL